MKSIKKIAGLLQQKVKTFGIMIMSCYLGTAGAFCTDAFEVAEGATDTLTTKMTSLCYKIFPLAIVICIVSLFITHDERKLAMEWKILAGLIAGLALLILVEKGIIVDTVKNVVG